jgi:predicted alpha/beta-fold hydrolase
MMEQRMESLKSLANFKGVQLDYKRIQKCESVFELEQCLTLPFYTGEYASMEDYYVDNSSHHALRHIKIPCLILNALDDILVPRELTHYPIEAARDNKNLITVLTHHGGHAGWLMGDDCVSWDINLALKYFAILN